MPDSSPARTGGAAGPIFVVGTVRSGTTLFAAMLDGHSAIACGPETALFRFARSMDQRRVLGDRAWPDEAVRFLLSLRRERAGGIVDAYGLSPDQLRAELVDAPHTLRSLLEAITVPYARARGKRRWAEKTPAHLLHLTELRRLWPNAAIIRLVRDPRGVAASLVKVPFGPSSVISSAYLWKRQDDDAHRFFETDRLTRTVRYEDLVADPEGVLRSVCVLLDEAFEPAMLETGNADRNVVATGEPWKWRVTEPIDRSRATAWRDELGPTDLARVALVCADGMRRHRYEGAGTPKGHLYVHVAGAQLREIPDLLEPAADAGYVLEEARADGRLRSRVPDLIVGPGEHGWTSGEDREGPASVARMSLRLAATALRGRPARRIERAPSVRHRSVVGTVEDVVVRAVTRKTEPGALRQFRPARVAQSNE